MRRFLLTSAALLFAVPAMAGEPRDLDSALKDQAAKILDYARSRNAKNIGVLKFLVRTGDGAPSDNAGALNLNLANRLTVALVLALPDDELGIIANANQVLAKTGASYLDEEGRTKAIGSRGFVLAWGDPEIPVKADLFITGTATLSKDLKTTSVTLQAFGKDGKLDESIGKFSVPTDTRTLIDTSHSYLLTKKTHPNLYTGARGGDDAELDKPAVDVSQKYSAELKNEPLPSFETEAPVRVTVFYGDEAIPIKNGAVREPTEKDKVWFRLENVTDETYGVVLKVNGESTIYREKLADKDCKKWILKPGASVVVRGFQKTDKDRDDFAVQAPEASKANEVRYGEFAGTFQVTAFRGQNEKKTEAPAVVPQLKEEQQIAAAISRGTLKIEGIQPSDLKSLQRELRRREKTTVNGRGMIDSAPDNPKPHLVTEVEFKPEPPIPVMSYRIRYYGNGK